MAWTTVRVSKETRDALAAIAGVGTHEDAVRRLLYSYLTDHQDKLAPFQREMLERIEL